MLVTVTVPCRDVWRVERDKQRGRSKRVDTWGGGGEKREKDIEAKIEIIEEKEGRCGRGSYQRHFFSYL